MGAFSDARYNKFRVVVEFEYSNLRMSIQPRIVKQIIKTKNIITNEDIIFFERYIFNLIVNIYFLWKNFR